MDTDNPQETQKKKSKWRDSASPGALIVAKTVTALLMFVVGLTLQLLLHGAISGAIGRWFSLGLWGLYILIGARVVISKSEPKDDTDVEPNPWSVFVLNSVVRGSNGERPVLLQLIVWLLVGQAMGSLVVAFGVLEIFSIFSF